MSNYLQIYSGQTQHQHPRAWACTWLSSLPVTAYTGMPAHISQAFWGVGFDGRTGLPCSWGSTAWGSLLSMTTSKNCHHLPLPCPRVGLPTCMSWVGTQAEGAGLWINLDPFMMKGGHSPSWWGLDTSHKRNLPPTNKCLCILSSFPPLNEERVLCCHRGDLGDLSFCSFLYEK